MPAQPEDSLMRLRLQPICHGLLTALLFFVSSSLTQAHEIARSNSIIVVDENRVEASHKFDLRELFPGVDTTGNNHITYDELDRAMPSLYALTKKNLILRSSGQDPVSTSVQDYSLLDGQFLTLNVIYTFRERVTDLTVISTLERATRPDVGDLYTWPHETFISVKMAGQIHQAVLDVRHPSVNFSVQQSSAIFLKTIRDFVVLGIEHIATGYDHMAFMLMLVVAATSIRSLVAVVTAFTIAHSLTLALAVLNIVSVPSRVVEGAIAASIVYVALENMFRIQALPRAGIAFLFGLIHGLGFSETLKEMALPRGQLAVSLLSFNVGIEIAQLTVVLCIYPLLKSIPPRYQVSTRTFLSTSVFLLASYWLIERIFIG